MKKISTRQFIIFYIIHTFAIKFLMLPHLLSGSAARDAWISAAIGSLIELALLFTVLRAITLAQDNDIYSTLKRNTGTAGSKLFLCLLLLFFLLQALFALKTTSYMLNETLYEDLSFHSFAIPLLLAGIFFCFMKTRTIFRAGEIFYLLIILGLGLTFLPSLVKINLSDVLPVFDKGLAPIFTGVYKNLLYFESGAFLLIFMGDVKIENGFTKKFMGVAAAASCVFIFAIVLFTSIFGPVAEAKQMAIVNLTQVSSYIAQNGRLEWIMVIVWLILLLLRFGITFYCCYALLRHITGIKHPSPIALPLAVLLYALHAWVIVSFADFNTFAAKLLPALAVFYLLIPLFLLINARIVNRRSSEVNRNSKTSPKEAAANGNT